MKELLTRHAKFARRVYASTIVIGGLLLTSSVPLEAMNKVPQGTTASLTTVTTVMIDKTRSMYLEANRELKSAVKSIE